MKKPILAAVIALAAAVLACAPSQNTTPRNTPAADGVVAAIAAPSTGSAAGVPPQLQAEIDALPEGDAADGEKIFIQQPCHVCHVDTQLAPRLEGLGVRAETQRPGYPAETYLYESIVDSQAYVVQGFDGGLMPTNFKETLTPQELADLVAFLLAAQ